MSKIKEKIDNILKESAFFSFSGYRGDTYPKMKELMDAVREFATILKKKGKTTGSMADFSGFVSDTKKLPPLRYAYNDAYNAVHKLFTDLGVTVY
jgi:hypothetical protein